jgi:hypothetical protein
VSFDTVTVPVGAEVTLVAKAWTVAVQVADCPEAMATGAQFTTVRVSSPVTGVPWPIWPAPSRPQQASSPVVLRAQAVMVPAESDPKVSVDTPVRPETGTGAVRVVVVPSPSWPPVLCPQHMTVPSASPAHTFLEPKLRVFTSCVEPSRAGTTLAKRSMAGLPAVPPRPS